MDLAAVKSLTRSKLIDEKLEALQRAEEKYYQKTSSDKQVQSGMLNVSAVRSMRWHPNAVRNMLKHYCIYPCS